MTTLDQKVLLASVRKLGGATPGEVAADLGRTVDEVMPSLLELANQGYLHKMGKRSRAGSSRKDQLHAQDLLDVPLELTSRGLLELSWTPWTPWTTTTG